MALKIGWSEADITPGEGVKIGLDGQFFERVTDEVESRITVTALAVDGGDDRMVIVSCDLVGIGKNLHEVVKEDVVREYPELDGKIVTCAIHTHTSYVYTKTATDPSSSLDVLRRMLPEGTEYEPLAVSGDMLDPDEALEFLRSRIAGAVKEAWRSRTEGFYSNAFGRAAVGMNRRVCYRDGSARMWGETGVGDFDELEAGNDSGIEIIYTYDGKGKLNGVVANVACPAQVVEHRSFISSDYWGKVRENLRRHFGRNIYVLGLISAAGDLCPRDLIRWVEPETPIDDPNIKRERVPERRADPSMFDVSGLRVVGRRISDELISVFEETGGRDLKDRCVLMHRTVNMTFPLRKVSEAEYDEAVRKIDRYIEENRGRRITFGDSAEMHVYAGTVARYQLQKSMDTFEEEIHVIRFGDVAIATNPFELFLNYGNRIRALSPAKQTFLVELACGDDGYLPTEKAERGSHYSAYVSSGITGHEGGDVLVRGTLGILNELFGESNGRKDD